MGKNHLDTLLYSSALLVGQYAYANSYLSSTESQKLYFSDKAEFLPTTLSFSADQKDKIKEISGVRQRTSEIEYKKVMLGEEHLGWFFTDKVIGKHEYITYSVAVSKDAKVLGIEINEYLETHGHEIARKDWREKFKGKELKDPFKLDVDIPNISGATLSSRNVTDGVKRILTIVNLFAK